jgi:pyruvate/2-oxoglutarate dehydrogenase complex dihydrolipoamide acyltransferase (E2) component
MAYVALKHLKWGDTTIAPGESVPDEEGRNYASLLRTKRVAKVPDSTEMGDAELAEAYEKALERVAELESAESKTLEVGDAGVDVPDDVTPGETPGWPIDAVTGGPLALSDEQRDGLAADDISGEAVLTHRGEIIAITAEEEAEEAESEEAEPAGQTDVDATDAAVRLAEANGIDLGTVEGSGKDGRIVEPDIQKIIDARS